MDKKKEKHKYKILCISDIEILNKMEENLLKQRFKDIDFIMSAGDVSNRYLDYLVSVLNKDIIIVNGNHIYHKDYPITFAKNIDGKFLKYKGLRILGLDGCKVYSFKEHQYTENQMKMKILKNIFYLLKGVDIVLSHASPSGIHDVNDGVHDGFKIFHKIIKYFKPKLWIHGHIHLPNFMVYQDTVIGKTTVSNTFGYRVFIFEK
ncbi:MAG: metallophosphoesterase [Leptotrichiaceae bacterium]|nr:metallophosphoesterase [Leptotrichiaceae bacterium]MBP6281827.1 metallophosphoesterase [Leptotrichiaceae bacterium]MBP7100720.1 metallophosphoesterase [Leptotrichiaceae bacterium]MBP7725268.1 metallophosphoesterase [Leptotrichiaceae bacterium]MBP9629490.1 metallophosphoesterase [Leptotrichiaceae bacterium]